MEAHRYRDQSTGYQRGGEEGGATEVAVWSHRKHQSKDFHPGSLVSELNSLSFHCYFLYQINTIFIGQLASLVAQRVKKLPAMQKTRFEP